MRRKNVLKVLFWAFDQCCNVHRSRRMHSLFIHPTVRFSEKGTEDFILDLTSDRLFLTWAILNPKTSD